MARSPRSMTPTPSLLIDAMPTSDAIPTSESASTPGKNCYSRSPRVVISGLNRTAFDLAVYASQGWSPTHHARLASGCWFGSTGRDWLPAGFHLKGFKLPTILLSRAFPSLLRDVSFFFVEKRTAAPKIRPGQTSAGAQNPQASHCGGSAGSDALGVGQLRRLGLRRQAYLVTEPFQA